MNSKDYFQGVLRTWNTGGSKELRLCNATLGLVGEAWEYVSNPTNDEAGDVCFYVAAICCELDFDFVELCENNGSAFGVNMQAAVVAEQVKKYLFHSKGDLAALKNSLGSIIGTFQRRRDIYKVFAANNAKLRKRYPDGFSFEKRCDSCGGKIDAEYKSNKCIGCDHGGEDAKA